MTYRISMVVSLMVFGGLLGVSCAAGGGGAVCGNHECESSEDAWSCPTDCAPAVCGDGVCVAGETTAGCAADCYCGNGTCDSGEDAGSCSLDCGGAVCGDGTCASTENEALCPGDCFCGNGSCDQGENETLCGQDCSASSCPDGVCQATETTGSCAADCWCGNGSCDGGESAASCAVDCQGPQCGDGTCDAPLEDASNCPADCGTNCSDPICDLWPQCGCQTGQKCSIDSADNHACMTAGSTPQSQPCAADGDCAAGTMCVGSSATDLRCHQFCVGDNDCPGTGGGGVCVISLVDSAQQPIPGATMCTTDCNPAVLNPTSCPTGWACHLQYVDDNADTIPDFFLTDCANDAGTAGEGGFCDNVSAFCAPGHWCYTDFNECIRTCRVGMSDCSGVQICQTYTDAAIVGTTEYGYCQ